VYASNAARSGTAGKTGQMIIKAQEVPKAPTFKSQSPASGSEAPKTITWEWNPVTPNSGTANLEYWVSTDRGVTWTNNGLSTRYSLNNVGPGTYTFRVYARNKAGQGPALIDGGPPITLVPKPEFYLCDAGPARGIDPSLSIQPHWMGVKVSNFPKGQYTVTIHWYMDGSERTRSVQLLENGSTELRYYSGTTGNNDKQIIRISTGSFSDERAWQDAPDC
jgi:hypothetical protein